MRHRWRLLLIILGALLVAEGFAAEQYMQDVLSGKQTACRYVRLAVERHVRDLARVERKDPDFPYYFDPEKAERAITFKQELRLIDGPYKGAKLSVPPWLQFKDWMLFGWRRIDGGFRRFRKAYIEVARKNIKTTDAASTALYVYFLDRPRDWGPQVYCLGPKKEQGKISWEIAAAMAKTQPALAKIARFYKENTNEPRMLIQTDPRAVMTVWGKDAATQDGFSPSLALVDEAHLYPGNEAMEVIESGTGARLQPLTYIITTAGFDLESPCYTEERKLAVEILEQTVDPVPEHIFAVIYTLDEGDDFTDEAMWPKANPSLDVLPTPRRDFLRERVAEAIAIPSKRNKILTKNFNIWTQVETRWLSPEAWAACGAAADPAALVGRRCYGGLDLSMARDLTAWVLCFWPLPGKPNVYPFLYRFFLPEENIVEREREDRRQYRHWAERGLVTLTPGPQVDYHVVAAQIEEDAKQFNLAQYAYDPYRSSWLVEELQKSGNTIEAVLYRQIYQYMAVPTALFERAVIGGQIAHGGNPVMKWMIACTEVKSDRQGLIMPMKPKRGAHGKRIDGVTASIMAYHRAFSELGKIQGSVYENRGVRTA